MWHRGTEIGKVGAWSTEDPDADGAYLGTWTSEAYELEADDELKEFTPAIKLKAGELVANATYLNRVPRAKQFYTEPSEVLRTKVRVQQVVGTNLVLEPLGANVKLPNTCDKKKATKLNARRLTNECHEAYMAEIRRREVLEYDELDIGEDDDEEDEEDEEEEGEDADDEDAEVEED